jgi:hypothetical protein
MCHKAKGIAPGKKFKDIAGTEELSEQKAKKFFPFLAPKPFLQRRTKTINDNCE